MRRQARQASSSAPFKEAALTNIAIAPEANLQEVARDHGLIRAVGTWGMTASIVNGVVGAGIFSLPAAMALTAGSRAPLAFIAVAVVMGAVVLCFAEASRRVPTSGGSYGYVEAAFGPLAGFVAGVLLWVSSVLACGGIAAALAAGVAAMVPAFADPIPRAVLIVVVIGGLGWINAAGVGSAARFITWMTLVKLVPLGLFVVAGGAALLTLKSGAIAPVPPADGFGRSLILALFAFCGMETPLAASGEVKDPGRAIPRALFLSMGFVVVLYIAVQLVAQGLLGGRLAGSASPLADAIGVVSPALGVVLLVGASISRLGWIASDVLGAPRVLFAFARDGLLPQALSAIHPRARTPHIAIALHAGLAILLAVSGTFEQLAVLSTLATCGLYFLSCGAAWKLGRSQVAVFGAPKAFALLPAAALLGMGSMVALVLFAEYSEIAGLVGVIAGSVILFSLNRAMRRPAAA